MRRTFNVLLILTTLMVAPCLAACSSALGSLAGAAPADRAYVDDLVASVSTVSRNAAEQGSQLAGIVDGVLYLGAAVAAAATGRALYRKGNTAVQARQHIEGRAAAQSMGAPSGQKVDSKLLGGHPVTEVRKQGVAT